MCFGSGGGVVDRHHAGADRAGEGESLFGIARVDGGREPVARSVGQLQCLVEAAIAGYPDDRAEGLLSEDAVVRTDPVDDDWVVVQPGAGISDEAIARVFGADPTGGAVHHVMRLDPGQILLEAVSELRVEQWAHQNVGCRVTDLRPSNRVGELRRKPVMNRLVHNNGAKRRASLPGGAKTGEERALHGEI